VPLPSFKEDLVSKVDTYSPIWDAAQKAGKTREEVLDYLNQVIDRKYGLLYTLHELVQKVKKILFGGGKPIFSMEELAKRIEGRTTFIGAFVAAYVVEKTLDDLLGEWSGLYSRNFKGRLNYSADSLIRQVRGVSELAGFTSLSDKFDFMPKRIQEAAIRDVLGWIKTGKDPNPVLPEYIKEILDSMKSMTEKVEDKLAEYGSRKDKGYGSDKYNRGLAAQNSGYVLKPANA
jgi:hypothetical protein